MENRTYDLDIACPHCGYRQTVQSYNDGIKDKEFECERCHRKERIGDYLKCGQRVKDKEETKTITSFNLSGSNLSSALEIPKNKIGHTEMRVPVGKEPKNIGGKTSMREEVTSTIQIPGTNHLVSHFAPSDDPTMFSHPATLVDMKTNIRYKLGANYYQTNKPAQKEGHYVVGRKDPDVRADVPISTEDIYMSRHHVRIIVTECDGYYIHLLRNEKNLNETLLDDRELDQGCEWRIKKNQILQLADTKFKVVDE